MTTVQETTIAQNAAIIELLLSLFDGDESKYLGNDAQKAVDRARKAQAGWLEQLET